MGMGYYLIGDDLAGRWICEATGDGGDSFFFWRAGVRGGMGMEKQSGGVRVCTTELKKGGGGRRHEADGWIAALGGQGSQLWHRGGETIGWSQGVRWRDNWVESGGARQS